MKPLLLDEIRDRLLRNARNLNPDFHVTHDSDNVVRATATASVVEGNYQYAEWVLRQGFADSADPEYLERHAAIHGLYRKRAAAAAGQVTIKGNPGASIPVGTLIQCNNVLYETTHATVITASKHAVVWCVCQTAGEAGNQLDQTPCTLPSAPLGVDSGATLIMMRGGTDIETDRALLERLLDKLRRPPAGGNAHDYYTWAMSVAGVTAAYVFPLRRGLGTVDIIVITDDGLPAQTTIETVQAYIDQVRPVTARDVRVLAPAARLVDVQARVYAAGVDTEPLRVAVTETINAYISALRPGQPLIRSQLEAVISDTVGVFDRMLITPSENVQPAALPHIEWLRPGNVTVEVRGAR